MSLSLRAGLSSEFQRAFGNPPATRALLLRIRVVGLDVSGV